MKPNLYRYHNTVDLSAETLARLIAAIEAALA